MRMSSRAPRKKLTESRISAPMPTLMEEERLRWVVPVTEPSRFPFR